MTNKTQNPTGIDKWTPRILYLLRRADSRQLREIYYIISGYLSAACPPPPMPRTPLAGDGGAEDRVVQ